MTFLDVFHPISVDEEEAFSANVKQYVSSTWLDANPTYEFSLTGIQAQNPTTAPVLIIGTNINIGRTSGVITGTAPDVDDRHELYGVTVTITATVTITEMGCLDR